MKVLVIGDLHGLNVWKNLIKEHNPDKVIFLGDYVDSFIAADSIIIKNLESIIRYKRKNKDKVVLLLGNHDIQYFIYGNKCSGYRASYSRDIGDIFEKNRNLFKIVHTEGNYIFSHAGFSNKWVKENSEIITKYNTDGEMETYNKIFNSEESYILFQCGASRGGRNKYSGPLWLDISEREETKIPGYIQVVGHTKTNTIKDYGHIIYCDNLEYGDGIPLILNIGSI